MKGVYQSANGGTTWTQVFATSDIYAVVMQPNASQAAMFNFVEAAANDLFAGLEGLHNTTLSCELLPGFESEVKTFVQFDLSSATQGQALIAQAQSVAASVPCR